MDIIPVELLTLIATDTFDIFVTLLRVPVIGTRLCEWYPQLIARGRFISIVETNNGKFTYLNNQLHSFNDRPAVEYASGKKQWYKYGQLHRRDLHAVEWVGGTKDWYWNDKQHRGDDLPATIYTNGSKEWYWHGEPHRENDQPAVIYANGTKQWHWHGKLRRANNLPVIETADGTKYIRRGGDIIQQT